METLFGTLDSACVEARHAAADALLELLRLSVSSACRFNGTEINFIRPLINSQVESCGADGAHGVLRELLSMESSPVVRISQHMLETSAFDPGMRCKLLDVLHAMALLEERRQGARAASMDDIGARNAEGACAGSDITSLSLSEVPCPSLGSSDGGSREMRDALSPDDPSTATAEARGASVDSVSPEAGSAIGGKRSRAESVLSSSDDEGMPSVAPKPGGVSSRPFARGCIVELGSAAGDTVRAVRMHACILLADAIVACAGEGSDVSADVFLAALLSKDAAGCSEALPWSFCGSLLVALEDEHEEVRLSALAAIESVILFGRMDAAEKRMDAAESALGGLPCPLRRGAPPAVHVGRRTLRRALALVVDSLQDESWRVQRRAIDCAGRILAAVGQPVLTDDQLAAVVAQLSDADERVRAAAPGAVAVLTVAGVSDVACVLSALGAALASAPQSRQAHVHASVCAFARRNAALVREYGVHGRLGLLPTFVDHGAYVAAAALLAATDACGSESARACPPKRVPGDDVHPFGPRDIAGTGMLGEYAAFLAIRFPGDTGARVAGLPDVEGEVVRSLCAGAHAEAARGAAYLATHGALHGVPRGRALLYARLAEALLAGSATDGALAQCGAFAEGASLADECRALMAAGVRLASAPTPTVASFEPPRAAVAGPVVVQPVCFTLAGDGARGGVCVLAGGRVFGASWDADGRVYRAVVRMRVESPCDVLVSAAVGAVALFGDGFTLSVL